MTEENTTAAETGLSAVPIDNSVPNEVAPPPPADTAIRPVPEPTTHGAAVVGHASTGQEAPARRPHRRGALRRR
jgi:hypothetical protein